MLKRDEITDKNSCFSKANVDEPIFIFRAQDRFAPAVLRYYARMLYDNGVNQQKIDGVVAMANIMDQWPERKIPD